jgi:alpha-methylacyl-CoA racemase
MIDGSAALMALHYGLAAMGVWRTERGNNLLDTGAHFYDVYETSDGKYVSIGSIEPQFYAQLLEKTGLAGEDLPFQMDMSQWPSMKERLSAIFKTKTRDEWCAIMDGSDVCFAPVLDYSEAHLHPHNVARKTFVSYEDVLQPAPAPRFSRTPGAIRRPPPSPGRDTDEALREWGFEEAEVAKLKETGAIV